MPAGARASGLSRAARRVRRHGIYSRDGLAWYSGTLHLLQPGDRIWVKAPGYGFVGVGRVAGSPVPAADYRLRDSDGELKPALDVLNQASYHRKFVNDPEKSEYFVPVEWLQTVPLERGIQQVGMFGNQNTVCRPTTPAWSDTVDRLKRAFPDYERVSDQGE